MEKEIDILTFLDSKSIFYERDVDLKTRTWIKRGGVARCWIEPSDLSVFEAVVIWCQKHAYSFIVVGNTSNCYFLNNFNPELVISTLKLNGMVMEQGHIICECGFPMAKLVRFCIKQGIAGYEGFIGLPGTVGGAAINNAGCYGSLISSLISRVCVLQNSQFVWLKNEQLQYVHRNSALKSGTINGVVTKVVFRAKQQEDPSVLKEKANCYQQLRKEQQEHHFPNLGSTFSEWILSTSPMHKWLVIFLLKVGLRLLPASVSLKRKLLTKGLLFVYGAGAFKQYVSDYNLGCYTWKNPEADVHFDDYVRFMKRICSKAVLEIELKASKEKGDIGILTFHRAINYGAFLQAFAMKTFLESMQRQVMFVDYWPKPHADTYALLRLNFSVSWIGRMARLGRMLLVYNLSKQKKSKMESEMHRYLNLPPKPLFPNQASLSKLSSLNCVVYGSDQIWWNSIIYGYEGLDSTYWGEGLPDTVKKVAYAPSMGALTMTNLQLQDIKKYLAHFDALSVREVELKELLEPLTGRNIPVVLDPVFLLDDEVWFSKCLPVNRSGYILYYNLMPSRQATILVKQLEKKTGWQVVEVTGHVHPFKWGSRYVQNASAFEWLSLLKSAELVISTSFHGVAFSIMFNKPFYALGMSNKSGRVRSLLGLLGLEDRLVDEAASLPGLTIDYEQAQQKLTALKKTARNYLMEAINGKGV